MSNPRFSIVIPTRSRPHTLQFTLQTCLNQTFQDYEVVVCDNFGPAETQVMVKAFGSAHIVYHRSNTPLCMRDNWELAYRQTRGDYVIFIGDDDGLAPYALFQLDAFLKQNDTPAITWKCGAYTWPDVAQRELANQLKIPVSRHLAWRDGRSAIRAVVNGRMPASWLPNIYHGMVSRKLIEKILAHSNQLFGGYMVDTYSSFAVAYFAGHYAQMSAPMSISGFSGDSHNVAFNYLRGKHANTQRYREDNARGGVKLHPWVPYLPTSWTAVGDSFLAAKQDLFPDDKTMVFDRRFYIKKLLDKPPIDALSDWPLMVGEIRQTLADDADLAAWFERQILKILPKVTARESYRNLWEDVRGISLNLDSRAFSVSTVADAVAFIARVLDYSQMPIAWTHGIIEYVGVAERWRIGRRLAALKTINPN